ncbi:YcnI family protein [Methylopila musalis]|uniref:YcnI family protein n=1 Tax=Methylopila musalis TaxID=1134781 RepID=A0ABW3Z6D2_9HYPH
MRTDRRPETRRTRALIPAAVAAFVLAQAATAQAHVSLETREAPVGAGYKAVFKTPHGCKGAPTTTLRVKIPEGVIAVKPMPKPGWTLQTVKGPYAKTYDFYHGAKLSEGVVEVIWSGGELPDAFYDEFVLSGFLAPDLPVGGTLYFPVVQECPGGAAERWIEIPQGGQPGAALDKPAPGLTLLPKR